MEKKATAKNTHYFKAFNADYRLDGIYHSLDSSEFRIIVILQSYADNLGMIRSASGNGYNMSQELTKMIGLNYRTVLRGLMTLAEKGIITVYDETNVIKLNHFIEDNVYRDADNTRATRGRVMMAKQMTESNKAIERIEGKMNAMLPPLTDNDGVIIDRKSKLDSV
jgi:hypothetical protein